MKWILSVAVVLLCALSGLLGLTAGINLNSGTALRYVINWGSLGDWVSGIGALMAVGFALWQSHIFRKEDVEDLLIEQGHGPERWRISVISRGKRPARVQGVAFYSPKVDILLPIKHFVFHGDKASLPQTLNYSEDIQFTTRPDMFEDLAVNAVLAFDDLDDLEIYVKTTLGSFKVPVLKETTAAFHEALIGSDAIARIRARAGANTTD